MTEQEIRKAYFNKDWHAGRHFVERVTERGILPESWQDWTEENLRDYSQTFAGFIIRKKNGEAVLMGMIRAFGHIPTLDDFTKVGIETYLQSLSLNYSSSTQKLHTAVAKSALNYFGMDIELNYKRYKELMKVKVHRSEHIFLNEEEIERFAKLEPQTEFERYAQKIFVISSLTGMRYSDASVVNMSYVSGGILRYTSQKTKTTASIPCGQRLTHFLNVDVEPCDNCRFWYALRALCIRAGYDEEITIFEKDMYVTKKKYELVSAHTARRSFCTNLYLRGMDLYDISKLAGHSSIEMTKKYICAEREVKEQFMDFFK